MSSFLSYRMKIYFTSKRQGRYFFDLDFEGAASDIQYWRHVCQSLWILQ
jgi:hypothetical protein